MKSTISFLTRMPGTFIVTVITLLCVMAHYRHMLDDRWWLALFLSFVVTIVANMYLFFAHMGLINEAKPAGYWIGFSVVGVVTVLMMNCLYLFYMQPLSPFPAEHALHGTYLATSMVVIVWAWFSLIWNRYFGFHIETSQLKIKKASY